MRGFVRFSRRAGLTLGAMLLAGTVTAAPAPETMQVVTPVFSQLVGYSVPGNFVPAAENSNADQYIQELVLSGQTAQSWTQMITLTGIKGLAANPNATPQALALRIGGGFQQACPTSFQGTSFGEIKLSGHDAFALVVSCGTADASGKPFSETALVIVIKGQADYYTLQWAERSAASKTPIAFDEAKWTGRFKALSPIKLCAKVAGEAPPFPSCANRK
ncbi:hypothetical protein [Paramagnetospirillum magneticum]|uniref:Uncharacterized protein n=1 Tax=Paramagnetospirillum magneticum (strain ATCC 700264 / AMB-1) TaxID=342108 RepID=Q2W5H9_PARM1|nr:hypothetical protein [Paramagnetospirillum magneticum]BAE50896.1 hypothetical protein amb2092 [Paramagnetospirillum magneticum AMB-1]